MTVSIAARGTAEGRYLKAVGMAAGDMVAALAYAEGQASAWHTTPEPRIWLRSAVDAMTSNNTGTLAAPRPVRDWIEAARPRAVVDRLADVLHRVPLNVTLPAFTTDAVGHAVGEGLAKPLSKFALQTLTIAPRKFESSIVVSNELLRHSNTATEQTLGRQLGRALVKALDANFVDPNIGGSVTNGQTTISSTGTTLAAIDADIKSMLAVFEAADSSLDFAVWVMAPRTAAYLAMLRGTGGDLAYPGIDLRNGGTLAGIPVLISAALRAVGSPGETELILLDPTRVAFGDDGDFFLSATGQASIEMSDTPTTGAVQQVSLFQLNLTAIRAEKYCGFSAASGAAAVLDNLTY